MRSALIAELGGAERLRMINARLILRTGISLQNFNAAESRDAGRVEQAVFALREMGFKLDERPQHTRR